MTISRWEEVNRKLVARAISELSFEEVLRPVGVAPAFSLSLKSGATYTFSGATNIWGNVRVHPGSLKRNGETVVDAGAFFRDSLPETGMSEFTLAQFFEEMTNTLNADLRVKNLPANDLALLDGDEQQTYLDGHPKILLNKGRMGWNREASVLYSPESGNTFRLFWIAVKKSVLSGEGVPEDFLPPVSVPSGYQLLPVHPWQWTNVIEESFRAEIENGTIIPLGIHGDEYRAQTSLRTLTNVTRRGAPDIKLSLSILNTSCVRGLPEKAVAIGPAVSRALKNLAANDPHLKNMTVLEEVGSASFVNPIYRDLTDAPYRLKETLGVIFRESALKTLSHDESHLLTAALFHVGSCGRPLVSVLIEKSGLSAEEWWSSYFAEVVIPLCHLQVRHGIGLVAHGQNIMLKLRNSRPAGIFIKDFQGDLRLLEGKIPEGFEEVAGSLTKLPPHYLIHDLFTGHFITVFRFVSPLVENFPERKFYALLGDTIRKYDPDSLLLKPEMERILLNKVRFAIGYGDTLVRPLPQLGSPLTNPLRSPL